MIHPRQIEQPREHRVPCRGCKYRMTWRPDAYCNRCAPTAAPAPASGAGDGGDTSLPGVPAELSTNGDDHAG